MKQHFFVLASSLMILISQEAIGALLITPNSDVLVGRNAFLAVGTITTQFDWSTLFSPNSHTIGQSNPQLIVSSQSVTLQDTTVNTIVGNTLHFRNWVDAPGFSGLGGTAVADLALDGVESFDILFGKGHQSVGFAVITGTGNHLSEVDLTGASFMFTALDVNNNVVGSDAFSLASGKVDQAWLTINSDVPFRKLEVREVGAVRIADQYFSNILTSETLVPEPASIVLLSFGSIFMALGRSCKTRQSE